MVKRFVIAWILVMSSCAGLMGTSARRSQPEVPKDLAPVDVKFSHLLNPELGKGYIGKRVRTIAAFAMMHDSMMGMDTKYQSGWVWAGMFAVSSTIETLDCDLSRMSSIGLSVLAPTPVGAVWADAKPGTIYEVIGVVNEAEPSFADVASSLNLEVESLKALGQCDLGSVSSQGVKDRR